MSSELPALANTPEKGILFPLQKSLSSLIDQQKRTETTFQANLSSTQSNLEKREERKRKFSCLENESTTETNTQKKAKIADPVTALTKEKKISYKQSGKDTHLDESHLLASNIKHETTPLNRKKYLVREVKMHLLPMRGTIFLEKIISGEKKFEGRICRTIVNKLQVGEELKLYDRQARWGIICTITSLDKYKSFETMLKAKGVLNLLPQLQTKAKILNAEALIQEGVKIYKGFPGSNAVSTLGVMAIGVEFIKKV